MARSGAAWLGMAGKKLNTTEKQMSNKRVEKLKFEFRQGARYSIDPNVVGKELKRIHGENGVIEPVAVVNESRPESAPLHPVFEWDDEHAAEQYRIWQARKLIKAVQVVETKEGVKVPTMVYAHVPSASASDQTEGDAPQKEGATQSQPVRSGYQPVSVIVQRPDMYASALSELQRRVNSSKEALDALRRAASETPDTDQDRMARIAIAVQAMQTASAAVQALH